MLKYKVFVESFTATGLMIIERNWLEIYRWEKWSARKVPKLNIGEKFIPSSFMMMEGHTESPQAMTESDLISVMDKQGIGTDATIANHIETIQTRNYVIKDIQQRFLPTKLGLGLFEAYKSIGYNLTKPTLRASMERDCQLIARGEMYKNTMMISCLNHMKEVFRQVVINSNKMHIAMKKYFDSYVPLNVNDINIDNYKCERNCKTYSICGKCKNTMQLMILITLSLSLSSFWF